jgi:hypothetical protein
LIWGALSDERTDLPFAIATGLASPVGLVAIFYCVRFETSLFVASYDSQGLRHFNSSHDSAGGFQETKALGFRVSMVAKLKLNGTEVFDTTEYKVSSVVRTFVFLSVREGGDGKANKQPSPSSNLLRSDYP